VKLVTEQLGSLFLRILNIPKFSLGTYQKIVRICFGPPFLSHYNPNHCLYCLESASCIIYVTRVLFSLSLQSRQLICSSNLLLNNLLVHSGVRNDGTGLRLLIALWSFVLVLNLYVYFLVAFTINIYDIRRSCRHRHSHYSLLS